MTLENETNLPVPMVLHYESWHDKSGTHFIISSVFGDEKPTASYHHLADRSEREELMVEEFLRLHDLHDLTSRPVALFTSSPVLRKLLREQAAVFPQLTVRDVATGQRLVDAWQRVKTKHRKTVKRAQHNARPTIIIGTDASKRYGDDVVGWAVASCDGGVKSGTIESCDVTYGEFYAIGRALEWRANPTVRRIEIVTDSLDAYRVLNNPDTVRPLHFNEHIAYCWREIKKARSAGVEVRVHWVRGHSGHVLNTFADRAAVNARRCKQWGDTKKRRCKFRWRIQNDLRAALEDVDAERLLPTQGNEDARLAARAA